MLPIIFASERDVSKQNVMSKVGPCSKGPENNKGCWLSWKLHLFLTQPTIILQFRVLTARCMEVKERGPLGTLTKRVSDLLSLITLLFLSLFTTVLSKLRGTLDFSPFPYHFHQINDYVLLILHPQWTSYFVQSLTSPPLDYLRAF